MPPASAPLPPPPQPPNEEDYNILSQQRIRLLQRLQTTVAGIQLTPHFVAACMVGDIIELEKMVRASMFQKPALLPVAVEETIRMCKLNDLRSLHHG